MNKHKSSVKSNKLRLPKEKAGVVAYRLVPGDEPLVLVVTARKVKGSWVFPVGGVEKGESLKAAAKRECLEESGYYVDVEARLSPIEVPKGNNIRRFTFYLAKEVGEARTWEMDRTRDWVPISKIVDILPDIFQGVAHEAAQILMKMKLEKD